MRGPRGMTVTRTTSVTKKIRVELTAAEIRKRFRLPDDAQLTVKVPGGGDWSNTDLNLDETTIAASWTEETSK